MSSVPNPVARVLHAGRLARRAFGPYKSQIALLTLLSFVSGLLEGIGVNAIIPLLAIVTGAASGGSDPISKAIEQFFLFIGVDFSIKFILVFVIVLFMLKTVAVLLINYIKVRITSNYEQEMRATLFRKMLAAEWGFLLKQKVGHFETVLMTNVRFGSEFLGQISESIIAGVTLLVYSVIALNISPRVTLVALTVGLVLLLVLKPLLQRTRRAAVATSQANKNAAHYINESVSGMKTIKTLGVSGIIAERGARLFRLFRELRVRTMLLKSVGSSLFQPISIIFVSIIFAISYKLPGFQFASLVAIIYLIQRIFTYIQQLQGNLHHMTESVPYLENVLEYERDAEVRADHLGGTAPFSFTQELTFDRVGFSYAADTPILHEVSFRLPKGAFYGVVGSSGGGKTTLVDLLLRLFRPTTGTIRLDGVPIAAIDERAWRRKVGYVSQDLFLMNDTIANNIRFYDESITDDELIRVARMAAIYDFIESSPLGFDTPVGERGAELSAGQRQRVVIARALARDPELLILDEATSALDTESEAQIERVIANLKGRVTVLAIAHRLALIANADTVLVLDKGTVAEQGEPKRLLADPNSVFARLAHAGK